jgi:predicted RNA-binding Zn-ribbon protein involved in translation (DUF1610 family)
MRSANARLLALVNESTATAVEEGEAPGSLQRGAAQSGPPQWLPGAEPVTMCMSCDHEVPESEQLCPNCGVEPTVVHRCLYCKRLQSIDHLRCYYCSTPMAVLPPEAPIRPQAPKPETAFRRSLRVAARIVTPQLAVAVLVVLILTSSFSKSKSRSRFSLVDNSPMGQSYALTDAPLLQDASPQAAVVARLRPREVVDVFACEFDAAGNNWFGVVSRSDKHEGYVLAKDVAAPRAADPERGAKALRHSLLALGNPAALPAAEAAVEYYRDVFPSSAYVDELRWLLTERKRRLAEHPRNGQDALGGSNGFYAKVAATDEGFADSSPETSASAVPESETSSRRSSRSSHSPSGKKTGRSDNSRPLKIGVVGGSLSSPQSGPSRASGELAGAATSANRLP